MWDVNVWKVLMMRVGHLDFLALADFLSPDERLERAATKLVARSRS
jgi:hypothetical protein